MSILIKGMTMPTDCQNCQFNLEGGCFYGENADEYLCPSHGRAEWCPLVPVADVASVKHGKWEMKLVCSECGCTTKMREKTNYCPHCGARMEGQA